MMMSEKSLKYQEEKEQDQEQEQKQEKRRKLSLNLQIHCRWKTKVEGYWKPITGKLRLEPQVITEKLHLFKHSVAPSTSKKLNIK